MRGNRIAAVFVVLLLGVFTSRAQAVYDTEAVDVQSLFNLKHALYIIRYSHEFSDTLKIPYDCELRFDGGCLSGPIIFDKTKLSGDVKLKGSSISGRIHNKIFDASWLCAMDGEKDDAKSINEMIEVCSKVYFPQGTYRLISRYNPEGKTLKKLHKSIKSHIGICKSDVELIGEQGTKFWTTDSLGTICIFSKPNQIEKSIKNIKIKNITFNVCNDGVVFHEFLHTIKTIGVNGLYIENCTFNDFWGDAICLSHYGDNPKTGERTRNQNVKILNNTIIGGEHHSNRNGISVISGQNVLIKGNSIKNVSRKDMPGGIDVEPNNSAYTIDSIIIQENDIESVVGSAICVVIFKGGPGHRISILSNRIRRSTRGISIRIDTDNTTDHIIVKDNYVDKFTVPYRFKGQGKTKDWIISGNTFERACRQNIPGDIKVDNLVVKNNKKKE